MKSWLLALVLFLALPLAASTIVSNNDLIRTHGGVPMVISVGANVGDIITVTVDCDHDEHGECFIGAPRLRGAHKAHARFVRVDKDSWFRHQVFTISSPSTGEQIIKAYYWWVGPGVHYKVQIIAVEPL